MGRRAILVILVILFILLFIIPSSGFQLNTEGRGFNPIVVPGETYKERYTISIGEGDSPTIFTITVLDSAGEGYSARSYFSPQTAVVQVGPGKPGIAEFTINVPRNVGDGKRYARIKFQSGPTGAGQVGIATAIIKPVVMTIKNTKEVQSGTIEGIGAGDISAGKAINIRTPYKNTGNVHYGLNIAIEVSDANGQVIGSNSQRLTSPLPGLTDTFNVPVTPTVKLVSGIYTVLAKASLDDGTLLAEGTGSFALGEDYQPPPPPTSVTIGPSGGTLTTSDGRITVTIPAGAIGSSTTLTYESVQTETLPATPSGAAMGVTAFKLGGIAGMLSEDATIKVRYITGDLDIAGDDASKLTLARWNEGENKWQFYRAEVNAAERTLVVKTNQLSTWAVLAVADESLYGAEAPLSLAVPLGALLVVLIAFGKRWRRG
jgi:hypothetical protein